MRQLAQGVVWQPSAHSTEPRGGWQRLGASELLVQWTQVDGVSFVPGQGGKASPNLPDWRAIAAQPWARRVILGLAGRFDAHEARASVKSLAQASQQLARSLADGGPVGFRPAGWYFPVEVDPTWRDVQQQLPPLLTALPRPLWISAFDNSNIGPGNFAEWAGRWLPRDVGIFFQDGVGLHMRQPDVALTYYRALVRQLGSARVRLIAEAFRPYEGTQFRPAKPDELLPQLLAYRGVPVFLFEGPQYLSDPLVQEVLALCDGPSHPC
jgi:hypothetical protein